MTVPLTEVFFPSVVVCNINQVRKSFFEELGIYDNDTFIKQIYFDYIEGKKDSHKSSSSVSNKRSKLFARLTFILKNKPLRKNIE